MKKQQHIPHQLAIRDSNFYRNHLESHFVEHVGSITDETVQHFIKHLHFVAAKSSSELHDEFENWLNEQTKTYLLPLPHPTKKL